MFDFQVPLGEDKEIESVSWDYVYGEWEDYVESLQYGNGTSESLELARTQIEDGYDGCLKAVLVANCPRLRDVKFVSGGDNEFSHSSSCLAWLQIFISDAIIGKNAWPSGLANLRSVSVGVVSDTWMDPPGWDTNQYAWEPTTNLLIQLVRLPNIERVYLRDYVEDEEDETGYWELLPAGSSSLDTSFLTMAICKDTRSSEH